MPVSIETPSRHSEEVERIEAAIRTCLGDAGGSWHTTLTPAGSLAHWWILDVAEGPARPQRVILDASGALAQKVCRTLVASVRPGARGRSDAKGRVQITVARSLPTRVRALFESPLVCAFQSRGGSYRIRVMPGPQQDAILVVVKTARRKLPLPLFFPDIRMLDPLTVLRILRNVLEGMGPAYR